MIQPRRGECRQIYVRCYRRLYKHGFVYKHGFGTGAAHFYAARSEMHFWSRTGHEPGWTLGKCLTRNEFDMVTNCLAKVGVEGSNPFARSNYFNLDCAIAR